ENPLRRNVTEIETAVAQKPFFERQIELLERDTQRLDPCIVLVNDVDLRHGSNPRGVGAGSCWFDSRSSQSLQPTAWTGSCEGIRSSVLVTPRAMQTHAMAA